MLKRAVLLAVSVVASTTVAVAQEADDKLAQDLANPLASIISLPFQLNFDDNLGPNDAGTRTTLNFQPVYPIDLDGGASIITRGIFPYIWQNDVAPGSGSQSGLGDPLLVAWYVPPPTENLTLGFGPALQIPSGSEVSSETWAAGFTLLGVYVTGPWTIGVQGNHLWDAEGDPNVPINRTFVQPFFAYTQQGGITYTLTSESAYDWVDDEWSVPINFNVSKLVPIGKTPVNFQAGVGYWATAPETAAEGWRFRLQAQIVIPKR